MMTMQDYLTEIEYAVTSLLPIIWDERDRLRQLEVDVAALEQEIRDAPRRAAAIAQIEDECLPPGPWQDDGVATAIVWEAHFEFSDQRAIKSSDAGALAEQVKVHLFSVGSVAGNLLQHAKQGISLVHGSLATCPSGRMVSASQSLKDVILQGRNQALHWEEGNFKPAVVQCFTALANERDPKFAAYTMRNLALDVVDLLGWTDFAAFKADMMLLS
jgi:hypothetical protein